MTTTFKAHFTGEYYLMVSVHQPPLVADPRGLWALCLSLREMVISDKKVHEGNQYPCIHLLNRIIPPGDRGEVLVELNDI